MEPFGKSIKRRKEIWEAMHPSKESGATCATLEAPKTGRGNEQFASATSEITGEAFAKGFPEGLT